MLKEKIEILNETEEDVLTVSQAIQNNKTQFKNLKKDLKKLLFKNQITKDVYNENFYQLKTIYESTKMDLKINFDKEVTYFVNQYEDFNNFKSLENPVTEKESLLKPLNKEFYALKLAISEEKDKVKKQSLKKELLDIKSQKAKIKVLYSKSIKNKYLIWGSLGVVFAIILGTLLLTYLFANKEKVNFGNASFILAFAIAMLSLAFCVFYIFWLVRFETKKWVLDRDKPTFSTIYHSIWMYLLNSLGVGVFAPMTATFKKTGLFSDLKKIPTTLNASYIVGGLFGGVLTLTAIPIDGWTLLIFVVMCGVGGYVGSKINCKINAKKLALTMGLILVIATILMFLSLKELGIFKEGHLTSLTDDGANWWRLLISIIMFFIFGILFSLGIGIYAPTMVLISLLGMQFICAFPIMMLCAASSGAINGFATMKKNSYLPKTTWSIMVGSVMGDAVYFIVVYVLIVKIGGVKLDIISEVFKWITVPIIGYSAYLLLKSYWNLRKTPQTKQKKWHHLTLTDLKTINYELLFKNDLKPKMNYNQKNLKLKYQFINW